MVRRGHGNERSGPQNMGPEKIATRRSVDVMPFDGSVERHELVLPNRRDVHTCPFAAMALTLMVGIRCIVCRSSSERIMVLSGVR